VLFVCGKLPVKKSINMPAHYPYAPSSTKRWKECPGSVPASKNVPEAPESEYAAEGTMCHSAGEKAIRNGHPVLLEDVGGNVELRDQIQIYVEEVNFFRRQHQIIHEWVETQFVHAQLLDFGGTADYAAVYIKDNRICLRLIDLKAGAGVAVHAKHNEQLLSYGAIISSNFYLPIEEYHFTIVQPRNHSVDPVQHWDQVPASVVEDHLLSVHKAMNSSHFKAGPHCRWCPVIPYCEPLRAYQIQIARMQFEDGDITQTKVNQWLEAIQMSTVFGEVKERAEEMLIKAVKQGFDIPNHKVVASHGHRKWKLPEKEMLRVLADHGIIFEQATSTEIKTPSQLEKVAGLDSKMLEAVLSEHTAKELKGYRVVDADDRGRPVSFGQEFDEVV
jgi:hypothetical protein